MSRGGKRIGAGRPPKAVKTVQIFPRVRVTTKKILDTAAFIGPKTTGEVIDMWAEAHHKKSVDIKEKKV